MRSTNRTIAGLLLLVILTAGCSSKKKLEHPLFEALDAQRTGIDFANRLQYSQSFNLFKYMYFYNGSGVGAGDFNNDGLVDLFFGANQGRNGLYLNTGNLHFKNVTAAAAIPDDGGWSTGISVVDINNDGLLDIYVCRVGQYEVLHSRNLLLVNQGVDKEGVPHFVDKAAAYGLDFSGFSTQAAFFDYDRDGDLDCFLLNHSVHQNGNFKPRENFKGTYDPLSGDRLFRNDGERFTDITRASGINSTAISYGLGVAVADINLDGYPDLYVGNDFHENDYLYINQKDGTFKDESEQCLMHTSQYSMGVDVADVNNDACPEIVSMDMLPSDPYTLKRSLGEDSYDLFHEKMAIGYAPQYTRNNLQFNRGNGMFSETGLYSGIAATDWSWAPLWMDFDNDGMKDLFISNGIPKRMNDIDYINFVSNDEVQQKINSDNMQQKDISLLDKFPEIRLPNKFYRNKGDLSFEDEGGNVEGNTPSFSNGAIYADLDNDGDLDIVVNNIDEPAMIYENKHGDTAKAYLSLTLKGPASNVNATGAKVVVYAGAQTRTYEKFPVHGFLSSMEIPVHVGLENTRVDSILMIWPDASYERLPQGKGAVTVIYRKGLPLFDLSKLLRNTASASLPAQDITAETGLGFLHHENHFVEFDREPLIPNMLSTEGPALAVADINGDGFDDVFVGAARDAKSAVFLQDASGRFTLSSQPALDADSSYEDVDACWADMNRDGFPDLVVASGGNEFYGQDAHNTPRLYLNDGKGKLTRLSNAFANLSLTASCVAPCDYNGDGYTDLFIGARAIPWEYGAVPRSYLLQNDGKGGFQDVTEARASGLSQAGLVTQASWADMDKDGDADLVLALEWGGITVFVNDKGQFTKKELTDKKGWWNKALPVDVDGDGDLDIIAGNLGLNSRLAASREEPVRLYYNDFDGNGKKEQLLSYYVGGRELPFASKAELEKQTPILKKKFLYAADFASTTIEDLFGAEKLEKASVLTADYFANAVFINKGNWTFDVQALPWPAQLSTIRDAVVVNADDDERPDILLAGNFYGNNTEMGRYDADYGTLLLNRGGGRFEAQPMNGLSVKGEVRRIRPIRIGGRAAYVLGRNNDSTMVIRFGQP